jgi:hypothetical protein
MAAPLILRATKKSGSNKPILGEGEHTYEASHDWGEWPPDIEYADTHGVCVNSQRHVYMQNTLYKTSEKAARMVVFNSNGKFVKSWGKQFRGGDWVDIGRVSRLQRV